MLKIKGKVVMAGAKTTSKGKEYWWARVLVMEADSAEIYVVKDWGKSYKVGESMDEFLNVRPYIDKSGKAQVEMTVRRKRST